MRELFESEALIFYSGNRGVAWYKPSQCLWSAPVQLRGKVNLSSQYDDDLQAFFTDTIGVRTLNTEMVYNELMNVDATTATVEEVKDLLRSFSSQLKMELPTSSPHALLQKCILPVRYASGQVRLCSAATDFAISDRKRLNAMFRDRIETLDFTMPEGRQLLPFIEWARLESRYLSRLVKEITVLDSVVRVPISNPTQNIKYKAHALFRIATHFQSPRVKDDGQAFYDSIRTSQTWETDRIISELIIVMNGRSISEQTNSSQLHIEDGESLLRIYVPSDESSRETCYLSALPMRLTEWIMTDPETRIQYEIDPNMIVVTQAILNAKSRVAGHLLEEHGIIEVGITNIDSEEEAHRVNPPVNPDPSRLTPPIAAHLNQAGSPSPSTMGPATPSTPSDSEDEYRRLESEAPGSSRVSGGLFSDLPAEEGVPLYQFTGAPSERLRSATDEYRELLLQVVTAATQSRLLTRTFDLSGLAESLNEDTFVDGRSFDEYTLFNGDWRAQRNRDQKVGAAGELFVFELLSSLSPPLSGFTRDNWKSTIRGFASVHPDYTDIDGWSGTETADIVYDDEQGTLTEILMGKGVLTAEYRGRCPRYYIEVKTTPGSWDTPFFMSHSQYQKVNRTPRGVSLRYFDD
ncbi:hypothetical protein SLS62_001449 [Diatrype stigma]|uniref:Protein NO VEIN C-terminal domain-containing protein n=1 Tax=Diatrype stigma TaxID=117547 RepID=A0AAN9V078_9PEZI